MANMIFRLAKIFLSFFLPGGLLLGAALLVDRLGVLDPWLPMAGRILPYFLLGVGALLSWRFHRSRLTLVLLLLTLTGILLYYFGPAGVLTSAYGQMVLNLVALLLPVNFALIYLLRERGLFSPRGIARLLFVLLQPLAVYYLLRTQSQMFACLSHNFFTLPLLANMPLPQPILALAGLIAMIFLIGALRHRRPIICGFFWALLAVIIALAKGGAGNNITLYFCSAGSIIILAVLETAYAMAYRDELTGLPARRALNAAMLGLGSRYTVAMLDIDFFKKFNDKYGHDVGDQVLCLVASQMLAVEGGGKAFRYGGEEFTILFPGKSREEALPHLEKVRESIANARFALRGKNRPRRPPKKIPRGGPQPKTVSVTISIGAAAPGRDCHTPAETIKAADKALYRAKKKGRNCVAT